LAGSTDLDKSLLDIIYLNILLFSVAIVFLFRGYIKWRKAYKDLHKAIELKKRIDDYVPEGEKAEQILIRKIIALKNQEKVGETRELREDLKEINDYITKWVHEIKIPLSVCEIMADRIEEEELYDLAAELRKEIERMNFLRPEMGLGAAYYTAVNYGEFGFGKVLLWSVMLIIFGTYWVFGSFFPVIIRYLINRKGCLYKGVNIISFSNIAFRIKDNYRTLAAVAVMVTACITSFGTASSFKYFVEENHKIEVPYTVTYISDNREETAKVDKVIANSHHKVETRENARFLLVPDSDVVVVKMSTFQKILSGLEVENGLKIISKLGQSNNEVAYIQRPGMVMSLLEKKEVSVGKKTYQIKVNAKVPLFGSGVPYTCVVVRDEEYEAIKLNHEEKQFNGIILDNPEDTEDLTYELAKILPAEAGLYTYLLAGASLYDMAGIIYFLGAFLFLVFVFATGSIIYFKILVNRSETKVNMKSLRNWALPAGKLMSPFPNRWEYFFCCR